MKTRNKFYACLVLVLLAGCAASPEKPVAVIKPGTGKQIEKPAVRPAEKLQERSPLTLVRLNPDQVPSFADDLDQASLEVAVGRSLQYLNRLPNQRTFRFGDRLCSLQDMKSSLLLFLDIIRSGDCAAIKERKIREAFDFYKATGVNGRILFTGYFEPVLDGALRQSDHYRYPIYRIPEDMIAVDLGRFKSKYQGERIMGRLEQREIVPYFSRKDIDCDGSLQNRNLEIAWLADPIEVFFLHIQGSGMIRLPGGETLQVGFAQWNGRPYRSIGKYLLESGKIAEREMSHRNIKKYLREHPGEMADILNQNESYIFFRTVEGGPIGSLGVAVTGGRSIASDPECFPRAALSLIRLRKPLFNQDGELLAWNGFSRFVLNQDTGGVIKGPGEWIFFAAGEMKPNGLPAA